MCAGTGGKPELGEEAAQESHQELAAAVSGADMVGGDCSLRGAAESVSVSGTGVPGADIVSRQ